MGDRETGVVVSMRGRSGEPVEVQTTVGRMAEEAPPEVGRALFGDEATAAAERAKRPLLAMIRERMDEVIPEGAVRQLEIDTDGRKARRLINVEELAQNAATAQESTLDNAFSLGAICVALFEAELSKGQVASALGISGARAERLALMFGLYGGEHVHPKVPLECYLWLSSRENAEPLAEQRWCCWVNDNEASLRDLRKEVGWQRKAPDIDADEAEFRRDGVRLTRRWDGIARFIGTVERVDQMRLETESA